VTGTISVIEAISAGRKAAVAIDKSLGGEGRIEEELAPIEEPSAWIGREEGFALQPRCELSNISSNKDTALKESQRCLQCDLRTLITEKKYWGDYVR